MNGNYITTQSQVPENYGEKNIPNLSNLHFLGPGRSSA